MTQQMHYPDLQVCVLAAGKGKRMRSSKPKVLHPVLGRPMIDYLLHTVETLRPKGIALVTGHASEMVQEHVGQPQNLEWVIQDRQLGTGHAVSQCEDVIRDVRDVLIVCGDTPLLRTETLSELIEEHRKCDTDVTVLTAEPENSHGYGRIVRGSDDRVTGIVEEKDADDEQRAIGWSRYLLIPPNGLLILMKQQHWLPSVRLRKSWMARRKMWITLLLKQSSP